MTLNTRGARDGAGIRWQRFATTIIGFTLFVLPFSSRMVAADDLIPLSIATSQYPHAEAVRNGSIAIPECRIVYSTFSVKELQKRFERGAVGDVIEVDIVAALRHASQNPKLNWLLVPVFPWREFPHRHMMQSADGRAAVRSESEAMLAWSRGILASSPTFKPIEAWDQAILSSASSLSPIFPESRQAEQSYFAETRIFPIMTALAVRKELVDANPWLPEALFIAFSEAKARALEDGTVPLPWGPEFRDQTVELMKKNYWSYGVRNNPKTLNALFEHARAQGVIGKDLKPENVFAQPTLQLIDDKGAKN